MSFSAHKTRVGVLRGGPSPEYEVSLKTGKEVLKSLEEKYDVVDILITKDGLWHENGFEKKTENILKKIDVAFVAMHGIYGEDGTVQKILENFNIPFTGSGSFASAICMNKVATKKIYAQHSIKTPFFKSLQFEKLSRNEIREIYDSVPSPFVVKPAVGGSSIGVYMANSLPELEEAVIACFKHAENVIVEERILGKEATCGVVESFRNTSVYPLLPIEIRSKKDFFDYDAKYFDTDTEEICPGNFTKEESEKIKDLSEIIHKILHLRHYSRTDFIVHPKRGVFTLETNPLPGLTKESLLPKSLNAIGSNLQEFLEHVINMALNRK